MTSLKERYMDAIPDFVWTIGLAVLTAVLGYFVGSVKFFKEHQLRMYGEALPALLRLTFDPQPGQTEQDFNAALSKVWLYGSKDVCTKLDWAIGCRLVPDRGNFIEEMKKTIVEIRKDIQPWWRLKQRGLATNAPGHFYIQIKADVPSPMQ
jgi:hypothetical protein